MHHVADVDADAHLELAFGRRGEIALRQRALDLDGALRRFERAGEFDQEPIAQGLDLQPVEAREEVAQQTAVLLQQLECERLVALR